MHSTSKNCLRNSIVLNWMRTRYSLVKVNDVGSLNPQWSMGKRICTKPSRNINTGEEKMVTGFDGGIAKGCFQTGASAGTIVCPGNNHTCHIRFHYGSNPLYCEACRKNNERNMGTKQYKQTDVFKYFANSQMSLFSVI